MNLVAVVRVRADDESVARKIVPTVLGALGTVEIRLANENNAAGGHHATVTDVDFSIGSISPLGLVRGRGKSSRGLLGSSPEAARQRVAGSLKLICNCPNEVMFR